MDPNVRQFGSNTCEVGYGLPSGHMQVRREIVYQRFADIIALRRTESKILGGLGPVKIL